MSGNVKSFAVIVAATATSLGIGKNGTLPWKLAGDMAYFKRVTTATEAAGKVNAVVMGRKTWQSIPERFRPLQGRRNVVLSRNPRVKEDMRLPDDVLVARSLPEALEMLSRGRHRDEVDKVFVIGGGSVYEEAVKSELCEKVLLTRVYSDDFEDCDTHFPALDPSAFSLMSSSERREEKGLAYTFDVFQRNSSRNAAEACGVPEGVSASVASGKGVQDENSGVGSANVGVQPLAGVLAERRGKAMGAGVGKGESSCEQGLAAKAPAAAAAAAAAGARLEAEGEDNEEEEQYLRLVRDIMDSGARRGDRTGTGTLSKFGVQMRFSLRDGRFPLLTTKRVFWRGVAEELLWFVAGCTNANVLKEKGVHIWDGNGSREFLDGLGLTDREEGDLGPVYGFQWRHFGAEYTDMHADYTGKGVDQLAECIKKIKERPDDRRIVLSAWNPSDLGKMALPPCHMFCQFYVADGELSCQMYQRSADMGLGVPFNVASYALLTRMVAQCCGLRAGDFVHTIGDAHVYSNHVEALREQLSRKPRRFPTLEINPAKKDIDSFEFKDFTISGYTPHKTIKMKMAV